MSKIFNTQISLKNLDAALLIARIGIGGMMLAHGIPKISGFDESPVAFMDFMGMGSEVSLALTIFAEVICSVFLLFGFATRMATLPLIVTMLVAIFMVHINDPFGKQEMAWHYLLVYVVLLLLGPGRYSIDYVLSRKATSVSRE